MSSMHRTLEGEVLAHHLTQDERMIDQSLFADTHGPHARSSRKGAASAYDHCHSGRRGSAYAYHGRASQHTSSPSEVTCEARGPECPLRSGDVLVLAPHVEHSGRSAESGLYLLTLVHTPSAGSRTGREDGRAST